jgi:hypothetical protein
MTTERDAWRTTSIFRVQTLTIQWFTSAVFDYSDCDVLYGILPISCVKGCTPLATASDKVYQLLIKNWPWVCTRARNEQISTLYQINYLFWLDNFRVLGRFLYLYSLNSANQNTVFSKIVQSEHLKLEYSVLIVWV